MLEKLPQTGWPVVQEIVPVLQPSADVQAAPEEQATHEPALQTPPVQAVPLVFETRFEQVAVPLLQSIVPDWHPSADWHALPEAHAEQTPALQTPPEPHAVPSPLFTKLPQTG